MNLPSTYSNFLKTVQNLEVDEPDELLSESSQVGKLVNHLLNRFMPACYILDYTRGKYIYASPRISYLIEHPVSYFLDGGIEFAIKLWNKQDLKVYSEKVLKENLNFLKRIPKNEHSNFLFQCNYRGKLKKGGYRNVVQESIFIKSAENSMPLATLGFLYELPIVMNSRIDHKIIKVGNSLTESNTQILSNIFFSNEEDMALSKREIEILKYLCDDLTSDEIAQKLFISKHTVDNHRRSLLEKTNIKSSVGLVRFAFENGYL